MYCTGRTTRAQPSELNRPETIEETAELVRAAGGEGIAVQVDHLVPAQVEALVARIERERGRLDVLVNDVWGADFLIKWKAPVWEQPLEGGLHMLRLAVDTHIITSHFALPLLIRNPGGLVVEIRWSCHGCASTVRERRRHRRNGAPRFPRRRRRRRGCS